MLDKCPLQHMNRHMQQLSTHSPLHNIDLDTFPHHTYTEEYEDRTGKCRYIQIQSNIPQSLKYKHLKQHVFSLSLSQTHTHVCVQAHVHACVHTHTNTHIDLWTNSLSLSLTSTHLPFQQRLWPWLLQYPSFEICCVQQVWPKHELVNSPRLYQPLLPLVSVLQSIAWSGPARQQTQLCSTMWDLCNAR